MSSSLSLSLSPSPALSLSPSYSPPSLSPALSLPLSPSGTGFVVCGTKESAADSDGDLDVDGDDTLEYGKAQYTEADVIPCSGAGEDQGEAREREALRGAVLKYVYSLVCTSIV